MLITFAPWATAKSMPLAILVGAASPELVEDPNRHQLGAVGEPGQPDPVVGLLGDRAGDMGPVAVAVEGKGVMGDEVVALDELVGREVGAAPEAPAHGAICDPGVEDGDGLASGARPARRDQVLPGGRGVDPSGRGGKERLAGARPGQEIPLLGDPAAGYAGIGQRAAVIGHVKRGFGARLRGGRYVVRLRIRDPGAPAQCGGGPFDADLRRKRHRPPGPRARELDDRLVRGEAPRRGDPGPGAGRRRDYRDRAERREQGRGDENREASCHLRLLAGIPAIERALP